jgi:hypothetical protein
MRRNWRDEARTAITELRGVSHGAREAEMRMIARQLSGHTDTSALRRAIAAHEFLEHLRFSRPTSYAHLENASLSIVEIIARWFSFDQDGALQAAEGWANGIGNVRTITKAMIVARPAGYAGKSGVALGRAYVVDAKPIVMKAVDNLAKGAILSGISARDEATGQTIDFIFDLPNSGGRLAVVVVGPYSNKKLYLSRSGDWVTRAFGLAWLFDRVVLALPDSESLPEYQKRISAIGRQLEEQNGRLRRPPAIEVVHTDVPKFNAEEEEFLNELGSFAS